MEIGIRELKTHLSAFLKRVQDGQSITVTDRGKPIARIVPTDISRAQAMEVLQESGILEWSGHKFSPPAPLATVRKGKSVSEILVENRR